MTSYTAAYLTVLLPALVSYYGYFHMSDMKSEIALKAFFVYMVGCMVGFIIGGVMFENSAKATYRRLAQHYINGIKIEYMNPELR